MKVYALAVGCKKQEYTRVITFTCPAYCGARSQEEAVGKGILLAHEKWPQEEEYIDHWGAAIEVPLDFMHAAESEGL